MPAFVSEGIAPVSLAGISGSFPPDRRFFSCRIALAQPADKLLHAHAARRREDLQFPKNGIGDVNCGSHCSNLT